MVEKQPKPEWRLNPCRLAENSVATGTPFVSSECPMCFMLLFLPAICVDVTTWHPELGPSKATPVASKPQPAQRCCIPRRVALTSPCLQEWTGNSLTSGHCEGCIGRIRATTSWVLRLRLHTKYRVTQALGGASFGLQLRFGQLDPLDKGCLLCFF